jgi:hypothetical protein
VASFGIVGLEFRHCLVYYLFICLQLLVSCRYR